VAAQLPRSFSASSEREPGSAAYVKSVSPWSAAMSRRLKLRLLADDGVVELLGGSGVEAHVVCGPVGAKRLALRRELADEVWEVAVVRVAARGRAQDRGGLAGGAVPVGVERLGARIEEDEPCVVGRSRGPGVQLGEERASERVAGQDVEALIADIRGGRGDRVEGPLDLRPYALLGLAPARPCCGGLGGAGEVEKVTAAQL
jgi:hypothetical protein